MNTKLVSLCCLLLMVWLLGAWGASPTSAGTVLQGKQAPAEVGISVDQFMADLKKRGFEVSQGGFQLWRIEDCPQSFEVMGTCYFNNPSAPYVLAVVPYWPDEYVDPATQGAFGATDPGYGTSFRFDPNEAIVIFGFLPPKAAYFGIQSYLFTRKGDYQTGQRYVPLHTQPSAPRTFSSTGSRVIRSASGLSTA